MLIDLNNILKLIIEILEHMKELISSEIAEIIKVRNIKGLKTAKFVQVETNDERVVPFDKRITEEYLMLINLRTSF